MSILKQGTAATIKLGPFVDDADGKTAETGLTISQADIRLSKNGGDFAQTHNAAGATADELGYYDVPLDTTDTDTLGRLRVAVSETGALPVWQDFIIVTANVYDSLFSTDKLDVAVVEIATDALTAAAVKADAVTKIQSGLATPTNITAGTITTVTNLTNAPTDMAKESTLTAIKGAGWSTETLVAIKAALDAIDVSGMASAVWSAATRTLTQSAASVVAVVSGSDITATRGDTLSASLTDVGALTGYSKVYFTVKRDYADADTASIIQIEKTAGLKYLNGAVGTPANGSLTIDDEATGDITIALDEVETAKLDPGVYVYDVQVVRTAGTVSTLTAGTFEVAADVTRATA